MLDSISYLESKGVPFQTIELAHAPHTVQDVRDACACTAAEIVKTLVFMGGTNVLAVVPGDRQVDIRKLRKIVGDGSLRMARPEEVLAVTNCNVGEVSPFSANLSTRRVIDPSVFDSSRIFAGSGQGTILLLLTNSALRMAWDGVIAEIAR